MKLNNINFFWTLTERTNPDTGCACAVLYLNPKDAPRGVRIETKVLRVRTPEEGIALVPLAVQRAKQDMATGVQFDNVRHGIVAMSQIVASAGDL